nr:hypothetical protein [uncultured archaeon]
MKSSKRALLINKFDCVKTFIGKDGHDCAEKYFNI